MSTTVASARRKYLLFGILAAIIFVLDQWTKIWARRALGPDISSKIVQVFDHTVFFKYAENRGVAFSMLRDLPAGRVILTLVAAAALVLVIYYLHKTDPAHTRLHVALGLVGGGAVGNLVDRALFGYVTDFVWVDLGFPPFHPWPAFNVADAALVVGVILMAFDMLRPAGGAEPDKAPPSA